MVQNVFNSARNKQITVRITDDSILFFWTREDKNYSEGDEFYWIKNNEWASHMEEATDSPSNWINHMREKNWFTASMERFINLIISHQMEHKDKS